MAFEETAEELSKNVASLGFDVEALARKKILAVDYVYIERSEIEETAEYDLEGLFARLVHAIRSVGQSEASSIRWRPCSRACRTRPSFATSFADFSAGSRVRP